MTSDIENSILKKLYNQYFENYVIGFRKTTLEDELSPNNPNDVRMALNSLADNFLISLENNQYKITVFGIKYLEEKELVDSLQHQNRRNKIISILKGFYEKDTDHYVSHEIILKELKLSGPIEILSDMKYLKDEGYLYLQLYLGGSFETKLTNAGYELSKGI
ncbi:MAG: hypothetical protein K8Q89_08360 [Nitrosarchaeum sp.]|nr:hypothetical protein [Nitrosarchaeum sp.]